MLPFFLARGRASSVTRDPDLDTRLFDVALVHVLAMEGGWTDDPHDPGGPTNLGITLAEFARHRGRPLDAETFEPFKSALRAITREEAASIYARDYWQAADCPQLPPPLAAFHFDAAVNQGVAGAARMLQRALDVPVDGVIGPITLAAARSASGPDTLARYADVRRAHYRSLSTFWRFGRGWLARVDSTLALARSIAADPRFAAPPQPKENAMTETTSTQPKWWAQSMTIWGVLITTLTTVLPVVAPALGFNISGQLIQQLGDGASSWSRPQAASSAPHSPSGAACAPPSLWRAHRSP